MICRAYLAVIEIYCLEIGTFFLLEAAMSLYLVQHGKCLPEDIDPERPLTGEGIADVKRIAEVAAGYKVRVNRIIHSGKLRALQTAEIFARKLLPPDGVSESDGLKPKDDVSLLKLDPGSDTMIVGHLPFMERFASFLVTGLPEKRIIKFQNGGIVCLDVIDDGWVVKWALMPHIG
jgi:phosphohistidine phosphatase